MRVNIKKLREDAFIPEYKTPGAAGFDIAAVNNTWVLPGKTELVATGLSMEVPPGHALQVIPRSGFAKKTELSIKNSPGLIDSDYRGELMVMVKNNNPYFHYLIRRGERIAQGVITPVVRAEFVEASELSETERGAGGFGSTGSTE